MEVSRATHALCIKCRRQRARFGHGGRYCWGCGLEADGVRPVTAADMLKQTLREDAAKARKTRHQRAVPGILGVLCLKAGATPEQVEARVVHLYLAAGAGDFHWRDLYAELDLGPNPWNLPAFLRRRKLLELANPGISANRKKLRITPKGVEVLEHPDVVAYIAKHNIVERFKR